MRVTVTIDTDGAAFEESKGYELSRILSKLAKDVRAQAWAFGQCETIEAPILDVNGNTCGTFAMRERETKP